MADISRERPAPHFLIVTVRMAPSLRRTIGKCLISCEVVYPQGETSPLPQQHSCAGWQIALSTCCLRHFATQFYHQVEFAATLSAIHRPLLWQHGDTNEVAQNV